MPEIVTVNEEVVALTTLHSFFAAVDVTKEDCCRRIPPVCVTEVDSSLEAWLLINIGRR